MDSMPVFGMLVALFVFAGCCGMTGSPSPSSSCPYGTYGETCSAFCSKSVSNESCIPDCMDSVRSYGLGDATTCCKTSIRQNCDATCTALEQSTQGDTPKADCMEECTGAYSTLGIPLDICYLPFA